MLSDIAQNVLDLQSNHPIPEGLNATPVFNPPAPSSQRFDLYSVEHVFG